MVVRVATVAFEGIEARPVDVQVQIAKSLGSFGVVTGNCSIPRSRRPSVPPPAKGCDHAPAARSPGDASKRWRSGIPRGVLPAHPHANARKPPPSVQSRRLIALKLICLARRRESPSPASQSAANCMTLRFKSSLSRHYKDFSPATQVARTSRSSGRKATISAR